MPVIPGFARAVLFALGLCLAAPAEAQSADAFAPTLVDASPIGPAERTNHAERINGRRIQYLAEAGEFALPGPGGDALATVFYTAYLRRNVAPASRPIVFIFNGGPGASASTLHLGLGPARQPTNATADMDPVLIPNAESPLDAADLIFFDPVATGYSRILVPEGGRPYWSVTGDVDAALAFLRQWIAANGRQSSPLYIMGESYGGTRAVEMVVREAERKRDGQAALNIKGVLLLSPAIGMGRAPEARDRTRDAVLLFPSLTVSAWAQGRALTNVRDVRQVFAQAQQFAEGPYRERLSNPNAQRSAEEVAAFRAQLRGLTGLSETAVPQLSIPIDTDDFRDQLLHDAQQRLGRYDTRMKGPLSAYANQRQPFDDPSMSAGPPDGPWLERYFRDQLHVNLTRPYRTLNLDANLKWSRTPRPGAMEFAEAFTTLGDVRIWVGGGYFDIVTPLAASHDSVRRLGLPERRITYAGFAGGHTVSDDDAARRDLSRSIRTFVTGR